MAADKQPFPYDHLISGAGYGNTRYAIAERPLEKGIAFFQGITAYRITLPDLRRILVWSAGDASEITEEVKMDLAGYLQSSGAVHGILADHSRVSYLTNLPDSKPGWSLCPPDIDRIPEDIIVQNRQVTIVLDRYLRTLYRCISRSFYQVLGEMERELRHHVILSGLLETLLVQMGNQHQIDQSSLLGSSLLSRLQALGSGIPRYPEDGTDRQGMDRDVSDRLLKTGLSIPLPGELRISWIDPILMAQALNRLVSEAILPEKRRKRHYEEEEDQDTAMPAYLLHAVLDDLIGRYRDLPVIVDPASDFGELPLFLLRRYEDGTREPVLRLNLVASHIHCSDPSVSSTMIARFSMVLHIINGCFSDPSLSEPGSIDQISRIRKNIQTGSCIFSREIKDEFFSEQEGKQLLHSIRPLDPSWPYLTVGTPTILISCPKRRTCDLRPETRQYLCRFFSSYSPQVSFSLLVAEYAIRSCNFPSILFLNEDWFSDSGCTAFRKWVRSSRVNRIIAEENRMQRQYPPWSCLMATGSADFVEITRIDADGKTRIFPLNREELPVSDGWNLEDPLENRIIDHILGNSVSLSEYCLGAVYSPDDILPDDAVAWISFIHTGQSLSISPGNEPDPDSVAVIRGPDPFLEGILLSPVIQWYWQYLNNREIANPFVTVSMLPVCQPDWYDPDDRRRVDTLISCVNKRSYLQKMKRYSRYHHDLERISGQVKRIDEELFRLTCEFYRLSDTLSGALRMRIKDYSSVV